MRESTNQSTFIHKMFCNIFGHSFKVSKNVTYHVKEYTCSNCKKQLTTSSNGNLRELTPKFKEINDILERIHEKRMNRLKRKLVSTSIYS